MNPNVKDLTGQTFGRLHVLCAAARPEGSKGRGQHWSCICACANEVVVRSDSLVQGWSTSCGCTNLQTTAMRANIKRIRTKPTVSVQPSQDWTKHSHQAHTSMNETSTPISHEPSVEPKLMTVKRIELEALRNTLANVPNGTLVPSLSAAKAAVERLLAEPPRTVKGEAMGEQTARLCNGLQQLAGATLTLPAAEPAKFTGLKFKPALENLAARKHSHYFKDVSSLGVVDVYRVMQLFDITDQAIGHALKKLLVAGGRGAGKSIDKDIQEAIDTLTRWQEMRAEDARA